MTITTATVIRFVVGRSSLGLVLVAQSPEGLCAVMLGDDPGHLRSELQAQFSGADLADGDARENRLAAAVIRLIDSPAASLETPLDLRGTEFQRTVWRALRNIPAGKTTTYTELAGRIGRPTAVRAVAHACATNALAVVVPCHRVVRRDGGLAGYRWGIDRKRALLDREGEGRS
jgi:AraC family transcriptional regulator of adaptative response/methylated-DNA-[protein]-cysteine methyltransferase